jgi:hypothetical protein
VFSKISFPQLSFEEMAESSRVPVFFEKHSRVPFFWKNKEKSKKNWCSKFFFGKELVFKVFLRVIQFFTCVGFIPSRGTFPG